ncbi:MAG TPA: alpha/beta hydrolase [Conexibacter sp.]|jgi:pimeloyl-ACP methyl ester carboxylesterase|nr:alpha/beta hydrolase [Conexibacter sp.]
MRLTKRQIALGIVLALAAFVVLLNWTWGRLPDEPQRTGRLVRLGDTTVRVLEQPGKDPAVVLIHGLPGTAQDFDAVTARLPGRHTIAFDRPGFGFSSGGYHPFAEQLTTIDRLLAAFHLKRPVLVGHSYGGTLALAYAERRPQAVRGLVLIDAAALGQHSTAFERARSHLVQFLSWPVVQPIADVTFSQLLRTVSAKQGDARAFDPGDVYASHEQRLLSLNMQHDELDAYAGEQLHADGAIAGMNRQLAAIQTPAVVIQGAGDKLVEPQYGRELAATLPHARLVMVSGGHMAPYVHPGVVAAAVRALLPGASRVTTPAAR